MDTSTIICPKSYGEFQEQVRQFSCRALDELNTRYLDGERGFAIELLLDRSILMDVHWQLWDLQVMFCSMVDPIIWLMTDVESYADYAGDGNETGQDHIMVYRIIVK